MNSILAEKNEKLVIGAWAVATFISMAIFTGGAADQLEFGLGGICLLFVENYHIAESISGKPWVFDAYSPSCSASVSIGSIGILLLIAITASRMYYLLRSEEPARNVILGLAIIATVWTFISLIMAIVVAAGVSQTCSQFEKAGSCGSILAQGFFVDTMNQIYPKNLTTINAVVGAGWVDFILWGLYAGYEWYKYRNSSLKWW
ncbi:hypothetical protein HDV06_002012 [Boothiomyces sp. JEL0866]|nr:hypothetical protein HDV06_002012 [Boothiomyces sp. JEL0866]